MLHFQEYTVASLFTAYPVQCFPLYTHAYTLHVPWALPYDLDPVAGIMWAKCPLLTNLICLRDSVVIVLRFKFLSLALLPLIKLISFQLLIGCFAVQNADI
jgi:hypothetical protein